jgi:hypothetical protein
MTEFCRVQDVADLLRITINPADTGVLRAIREASALIQNYTHQTLELVANDVITLDVGTDQRKVFLPELPVVSVTSVVEDGDALVVGSDEDYQLGADGILYRRGGRGFWTPGIQNLVVTYTHGYPLDYDFDGWPDDIRGVCTRSAARALQAGLRAAETGGVAGVSGTTIGDYQVSYSADALVNPSGSLLGVTAAPVLLRSEKEALDRYKYKRQVPG